MTAPTAAPLTARTSLNAVIAAAAGIGSQLVLLACTPFLVWRVGLEAYGLWALCNSLSRYGLLTDVLFAPAIKYVSEYRARGELDRVRMVATFSVLFYAVLFAVFVPLTALLGPRFLGILHISDNVRAAAPIFLTGYVAFFFGTLGATALASVLSGLGLLRRSARLQSLGNIVFAGVAVIGAAAHAGLWAFLFASVAQWLFTTTSLYIAARRELGAVFIDPRRLERDVVRRLFTVGGWMQLTTLGSLLGAETSQVIIATFIGVPAVALFEVGGRLARSLLTIAYYANSALLPSLSTLDAHGELERLASAVGRASRILAVPLFAAAGILVAAASPIARVWLGGVTGLPVVSATIAVLAVTYLLDALASIPMTALRAQGRPRLEALTSTLGAVVKIALTLSLVRAFGVYGVLAGMLAGSLVSDGSFLWRYGSVARATFGRASRRWLLCALAAAVAAGLIAHAALAALPGAAFASRPLGAAALAVVGIAYLAVFAATLLALRFFAESEIVAVRRLIARRAA